MKTAKQLEKGRSTMKFTASGILFAVAGFSLSLAAQQQHFPTNEELRHLRGISQPQLSPDGKHVVAIVQDSTAEGGRTHLWLLSTGDGGFRQLTFGQGGGDTSGTAASGGAGGGRGGGAGERGAEYLPDGSAILFQMRREGTSGLFRLPLEGGEAIPIQIERVPAEGEKPASVEVASYSISPDGKMVAVVASDPQPASHARDLREKRDVLWVEHDEPKHRLYLLDTKTWKATEVPKLTDINGLSWTEPSDKLLVLVNTHLRDLGPSAVGWTLTIANPSEQTKVDGLPVSTRHAAWLHDGKSLLLFAKCEKDAPESCSDLFTFDIASGKMKNLTASLKDSTISGEALVVAEDDKSAVIAVSHGMHSTPAVIDLSTGALKMLDLGVPVVSGLRRNATKTGWVYEGSSSTVPPTIYYTTDLHTPGKAVAAPELVPSSWMSVASKRLTWKRGNFTIEGLLYLPPQAASGKVPLVVNVHGGPTGQFTDSWSPLTSLLLGQGWAVLVTNPRGSTGYGIEFEAANKDDMGNGDYLDIMAGVDEVIKTEPVDPSRMALIGYSYGGEMAGFVEGKTDRFKAIVSGAPVIDQFSEYGTESGSFGDRWFTGQPWMHFESAWRQSPLAYAGHAKTPFMLLQGQSDTTDPEGQSKEMYRALRQEGVPVQLLLFPREDHGALGGNFAGRPSTEPWAGVIARQHMIDFIRAGFEGKVEPNQP
jgi:dipeptidyl aminopeptidase/acylaminoacyl peptidase